MENENKKVKTPKEWTIFGLKIFANVLFYLFLVTVTLFSIANIRGENKNDKIPNVFGTGYLTVLSNSMMGDNEDSFEAGDLIIVKTATEKRIEKLEVGDIVTFFDYSLSREDGVGNALNSHRIIFIDKTTSTTKYYLAGDAFVKSVGLEVDKITKESAEDLYDNNTRDNIQCVTDAEIKGIYSSKISGLGNTIIFINEHFVVCIIIPVALFFALEVGLFIYHLMKMREEKLKLELEKTKSESSEDEEALKERLKEELRAQLLAELEANKKEEENEESNDSEESGE